MELKTPIPEALVRELEAAFPSRCPALSWPDREVWYRAGQASVAMALRTAYEAQNELELG